MFDVFGSVKGLLKLDQVCIDNNIFRLHYKATVIILIAFSLLVTSRQYIGDPIGMQQFVHFIQLLLHVKFLFAIL